MGLGSWSLFSFPELRRHISSGNSFAQPYIAERDTAAASVEPEIGRQDDSSAIVTDVCAGVDVRLSRQGHEESEWDNGSEECVFCFCSPCVTSVRQQWLGHVQDAHKKNSGIRKKLYSVEHGGILYTFIKRWLRSVKTMLMKLLCMCLERSWRSVSLN